PGPADHRDRQRPVGRPVRPAAQPREVPGRPRHPPPRQASRPYPRPLPQLSLGTTAPGPQGPRPHL
ncbi:MAG: hypothetical protein AVDCRST_MAG11-2097, partial [uncultured Gemmatimonadaceae bacterium]